MHLGTLVVNILLCRQSASDKKPFPTMLPGLSC